MIVNDQVRAIRARLAELTYAAQTRMSLCSPDLVGAMGGAEIDFMTPEEKAERHSLVMSLPSTGEEMLAARERIQERIRLRKQTR